MIFSIVLTGYIYTYNIKSLADSFINHIYDELAGFQMDTGDVSIKIPEKLDGYLVFSAPYAAINKKELSNTCNGNMSNVAIINAIQDDSAYHIFVINDKKVITHQKWKLSPIVFNNFFCVPLVKNGFIILKLEDKVLRGMKTISEKKKLVE